MTIKTSIPTPDGTRNSHTQTNQRYSERRRTLADVSSFVVKREGAAAARRWAARSRVTSNFYLYGGRERGVESKV